MFFGHPISGTTETLAFFEKVFPPIAHFPFEELMNHMRDDKKNRSNRILGVLLEEVSRPHYDLEYEVENLSKIWDNVRAS